ncbi:2-keto-4-pentenoate hydratase [Youngiibacter fragilis]|uniref:2-keto-4-pentenoate hydratase n=1 Tax=Youngiibacter fragilis 232.1 TaxID=994573 RepID=V7I6X1_9CLOT|nr:fumarylacetoacetate hydrolase family protein [Youngiibacter fragilis]ETA81593.1 2-keto-4-pentenoate hydratase [Youngiibacter fragilis 232.1]
MPITKEYTYEELANLLKQAERTCIPVNAISKENPEIEIADAYAVQLLNIGKEVADGRKITGKKIGLTSLAMQNLLGVNRPDFGHLLDTMEVKDEVVDRKKLLQPKVEGELAFVLKKDLAGPGVTSKDVIEATDYVVPSIEIVDSRIANWKINIIDTVADNASSGMYVVGKERIDPMETDLLSIKMKLYKNGEYINGGIGSDVLGDPAEAVAWLANTLSEFGVSLKKGEVVLSGAFSAALAAEAGDEFTAVYENIGEVKVKFV